MILTMRRRLLTHFALVTLAVAVLLAAVGVPAAEAQTGAKGAAYDSRVLSVSASTDRVQLWSGGWAVNPRTKPVQTVMAKVWSEQYPGWGERQLLYTSGQHVANGSTYDAWGSIAIPKGYRKYTFWWKSVPFNGLFHGHPAENFLMCYYAHDKGSTGGWTRIACYRQHPQ